MDEPIDGSGSGPLSLTEEPSSSQVSTDVLLVSVQQTPPPQDKKPLQQNPCCHEKPLQQNLLHVENGPDQY